MSIRPLAKRRTWALATTLLPALLASCSLEVAGIQEGSGASSGQGQTSPAADTGQGVGAGGPTASSGETTTSATTSSGGVTTSTSSGGATPPPDPCGVGTVDDIYDSFDDNTTNTMFWAAYKNGSNGETSITESGNAVNATSNGTKGLYAGYYQIGAPKKLNDCRAFIEVRQVAGPANPISTYFQLLDDSNGDGHANVYNINYIGGRLYFNVMIDGKPMTGASKDVAYDPGEHRWWRFRENQGTSYMDTSPTGKSDTWTTQLTFKTPAFASKVRFNFGMGPPADAKPGGTAVFDNLNVPPP